MVEKIIRTAEGWLGVKEPNHTEILNTYNNHSPLSRGYKVKKTDAWCATFVSAVFIKAGLEHLITTECSCSKMLASLRSKGMEVNNPRRGDIIFYDWNNDKVADHIGIILRAEKVPIGDTYKYYLEVIEGNYSNSVKVRAINSTSKNILAFCRPAYQLVNYPDVSEYYPIPTNYVGNSIVMALKSIGEPYTFNERGKIASRNGIPVSAYKGTAEQNLYLVKLLYEGKLRK